MSMSIKKKTTYDPYSKRVEEVDIVKDAYPDAVPMKYEDDSYYDQNTISNKEYRGWNKQKPTIAEELAKIHIDAVEKPSIPNLDKIDAEIERVRQIIGKTANEEHIKTFKQYLAGLIKAKDLLTS